MRKRQKRKKRRVDRIITYSFCSGSGRVLESRLPCLTGKGKGEVVEKSVYGRKQELKGSGLHGQKRGEKLPANEKIES